MQHNITHYIAVHIVKRHHGMNQSKVTLLTDNVKICELRLSTLSQVANSDILVLKLISVLVFILFSSQNFYSI